MADQPKFDQSAYWLNRHKEFADDPRSVGNLGASREANVHGELTIQNVVAQAALLLAPLGSVLDVGCGYGRVASSFLSAGFEYTGVDVSPDAIRRARLRFPRCTFFVADLARWQSPRRFGLVSALYVFVHFVDDAAWNSIVERSLTWTGRGRRPLVRRSYASAAREQSSSRCQPAPVGVRRNIRTIRLRP